MVKELEVDFDKVIEYSEELTDYEGKLPLLVRAIIMKKYTRNLNKKGLYNQVMKECVVSKPHSYGEAVTELNEWVQDNPQYNNMIKEREE